MNNGSGPSTIQRLAPAPHAVPVVFSSLICHLCTHEHASQAYARKLAHMLSDASIN